MKFNLLKRKNNLDKTKEKSCGRSMVEMLGVLAIIGVLSIGGIQGYTIAMRKYRANEIVDYLSKVATISYTGFQNYAQNNDVIVSEEKPLFGVFSYNEYFLDSGLLTPCRRGACGLPYMSSELDLPIPADISYVRIGGIYTVVEKGVHTTTKEEVMAGDYIALNVQLKEGETALCKTLLSDLSMWPTHIANPSEVTACDMSSTLYKIVPIIN